MSAALDCMLERTYTARGGTDSRARVMRIHDGSTAIPVLIFRSFSIDSNL